MAGDQHRQRGVEWMEVVIPQTRLGAARVELAEHETVFDEPRLEFRVDDVDHLEAAEVAIGLSWVYAGLLRHLPDRPVYGLQLPYLSGGPLDATPAELAHRYVEEMRAVQPQGPYTVLGWSQGGLIAHHMGVELRSAGETVDLVVLDYYPLERERRAHTHAELLAGLASNCLTRRRTR
ncbi:hypothetical protein CEJ39_13510 [Rhodococcus pyridinivorans]|nr:hypothetical protein CEJ39_13510 [Rhodococcus pyridinivorans]